MKNSNSSIISKASNESVAMVSKRMLETVSTANIQEVLSGKAYLAHAELSAQFEIAAVKLKRKELSEPVNKCYNDRRSLFVAVFVYVKGLCNAPDAEMAQAAQQVFKAINTYGQFLGNSKIEVQSFRYIRIIEALKQPELAAALSKMQLAAKVTELDGIQREYENQFINRSNKFSDSISASSLRRKLNEAIKLHVDELNWMLRQTESEAIRKLCNEVNARIADLKISSPRNNTDDNAQADTALVGK